MFCMGRCDKGNVRYGSGAAIGFRLGTGLAPSPVILGLDPEDQTVRCSVERAAVALAGAVTTAQIASRL